MIRTHRAIGEAFAIATVITSALVALQVIFTTMPISLLEVAAVFFSFATTWLSTRQVRFSYVLAVISTALLVYTFWQANLYGSMALNIYLIPTVIYGWFIWGKDTNPRPVKHVKAKNLVFYAFFTFITWLGALYVIEAFGGQMGALDGWLLVGTVLAQFLLDRKKLENWLVWAAVNVVSVYVYFESGLYLLAAQFFFFLINAVIAWFAWKKTMDSSEEVKINALAPHPAVALEEIENA